MPESTWRQRYEQARSGPGNRASRFFRGLLHASSPNDFPLDSRNTFNWFGGDGMGGRNSLAGAAVRGAIDPTGLLLQPPSSSSGRGGVPQANVIGGRSGSVVANGFVGRPSGIGGLTSSGPSRPSMPSRSDSLGIPAGDNPITRNDPRLDPSVSRPNPNDMGPFVGGGGLEVPSGGRERSSSRERGLGAGALGSAGDAFTADHFASLHNRRGLLAER